MTMSVTASFGSFLCPLERDRRETRFLPERLDAARFAFRLAIIAGIVLQLAKTASGFRCRIPEQERPASEGGPYGTCQAARFLRKCKIDRAPTSRRVCGRRPSCRS